MNGPRLRISDLTVSVPVRRGLREILSRVNLEIDPGEAVALVGESGSGKSTTARAVMRLLPESSELGGDIEVDGQSVLTLSRRALREFRLRNVAMIYQEPRMQINPVRKVGDFLTEGMREQGVAAADAWERSVELLESVSISDPELRMKQYPGELSGGMLQRVVIAAAVASGAKLVLADEPTSALDVTTQEEVVAILKEECSQRGVSLLFITHDLDLAAAITDRIAVMYAGEVVEVLQSAALMTELSHPYTIALLGARPSLSKRRLEVIPGRPIAAYESGAGCAFAPRCRYAEPRCVAERPMLRRVGESLVACHRSEEIVAGIAIDGAMERSRGRSIGD